MGIRKMQRGILLAIALLAAHGVAMGADVAVAGNDLAVVESRYTSEGGFIPAVNERRDAAAVFAIAGAIRVNAMADHCSALGPLEAVKANEARNRWMRHNGAMVRAANGYVHLQRAIVQVKLEQDPFGGHVFVFRGRRGDLIKVLWWDGDGLCLFAKRLERRRFIWPQAKDGTVALTRAQLSMLLEGID